MQNRKKIRKVFYHVLEGSPYLLADERDKRRLLDILFDIEREEGWLIYAFCITDDSAYFIIEADGSGTVRRGMQRLACRFQQPVRAGQRPKGRPAKEYPQGGFSLKDRPPEDRPEVCLSIRTLRELSSLSEIASCCRQIHRLPLEEGYVSRIGDYWWSSYITYTGEYNWALVDCQVVSLYFSADPDVARSRLRKFHQ